MPRKPIKRHVRESVLNEFGHRCALCGAQRPQIHHLDEDSSNNHPLNLIPLCPNHHLNDAHDPTRPVPYGLLTLLRKYRDPFVFHPRFRPIYLRFSVFYEANDDLVALSHAAEDLVAFLKPLMMGGYYSAAVQTVLALLLDEWALNNCWNENYPFLISRAEELLVEMLRYQGWSREDF
jgi:hypothetical protein